MEVGLVNLHIPSNEVLHVGVNLQGPNTADITLHLLSSVSRAVILSDLWLLCVTGLFVSAVYDYQFVNSDGCVFNKLVFLNW